MVRRNKRLFDVVTETIKDLDRNKSADLFEKMLSIGGLVEVKRASDRVLFIFPDGRMIGTEDKPRYNRDRHRKLKRWQSHCDVYLALYGPNSNWSDYCHPANNSELSKIYNLIIVSPHHTGGRILIPRLVDPTEEQLFVIEKFTKAGYIVDGVNDNK